MKVAEAIAQTLKKEGVEFIIGYPVNPILEAAAVADIRTIIVRQERIGLHMVDAVSRLSSGDKIGVFVMQNGPGSENAFGGVAQAYSESVPILVMPAGNPRRLMNYYPNFNSSLNFKHVTKWCEPLTMGRAIPEVMRRAFSQIRNGRPGPVLIEVPLDVFGEDVPDWWEHVPPIKTLTSPDPKAINEVAEVLANAERPVIYAGQGVHYARAWDELKELAESWSIPVTTSLEGKSAFPENHPLSLGSGGRSIPKAVRQFLDDADVIFGLGCSFALTAFGVAMPRGKTIIHATLDPMDFNKDVPAQYGLIGDAKLTLQALLHALKDRSKAKAKDRQEKIPAEIKEIKKSWLAEWMPKLTSDEIPINPYRVIWDLLHIVDVANTIITHDAGSPRDQMSPFWQSITPLSYIGWGKTTQLGSGLGLIMGAKLTHPDKLCINLWGDAAIGMTGMDFETAVRERIPILSILMNNFSMAIELPVMPVATEKYRSTDISGNYADMAKAFGGYGERISAPAEIIPAIKRGIKATQNGQPALLEFLTSKEISISRY
ncbi:MAG: thiamine pyrophosphate-requiring protein [Deltaproteobacteria bacterium]|nr:thiamine pyrophosphate-requiring protein [Deltaproteobacteria bacterium]MBW2085672.1 thiamine pyrophosphate-requiring protein [Deltaproteobacteria bacterium]